MDKIRKSQNKFTLADSVQYYTIKLINYMCLLRKCSQYNSNLPGLLSLCENHIHGGVT